MVCEGPLPEPIENLGRCGIEVTSAELAQRGEPFDEVRHGLVRMGGGADPDDSQTTYNVDSGRVSTLRHANAHEARIG